MWTFLIEKGLSNTDLREKVCDLAAGFPCPLSLHVSRQYTLQPVTMPPLPTPLTNQSAKNSSRLLVEVMSATGAPYSDTVANSSQ